ncbi:MAG: hypothetical protein MUC96_29710 [Myxococcaceae bacterium]|jgi:hypothetical protein|nr:hypothetical protein [Myxococcaceae bacterium]
MFALALTAALLSQTPELRSPVAVTLTSRRPNTDSFAPKVAARVVEVLKREGLGDVRDDGRSVKELKAAGFSDPRSCNGGQACSARLAVLIGPKAVLVGVDVGKVGKSLAIHLEAFAADLTEPIAVADLTAREDKWADQSLADITTFARQVKDKLAIAPPKVAVTPPPPPPPLDKPRGDTPAKTNLEPSASNTRTDLTETAEAAPSKVPAIVVASGAGAAVIVAGIFAGLAASDRATWDRNVTMQPDGSLGSTTLTQAEVAALGNGLNTKASVALGSGLLALALGGVATWLFLK